jgi:DNA-binding MarR family transcriptional regulator
MINHNVHDEPVETRLVVALLTVLRRLKDRTPGVAVDPAAFFVLHAVSGYGQLRPSDLAERLRLDASTVSRHVRQLESAGYLHRAVDPHDRRACQVSVSEAGRSVVEHAFQVRRARVAAAVDGWPVEDREQLAVLLARLAGDLDADDRAGPDPMDQSSSRAEKK